MGRRRTRQDQDDGLSQEVAAEVEGEEGEEGREPRIGAVPNMPSKAEREQHELTHTPYRSWCEHCVRARGRNRPHQKGNRAADDGAKVPRISFDYFFFSQEEERANQNPMIVMIDEETGEKYARSVDQKGLGEDGDMDWLVADMLAELKSWGHQGGEKGHLIFKSDGESATKRVRDQLAKELGGK